MQSTNEAALSTWRKNIVLLVSVSDMRVRDKRLIFQYMRAEDAHEDVFLPHFGLTLSSFATFQVLSESQRRTAQA